MRPQQRIEREPSPELTSEAATATYDLKDKVSQEASAQLPCRVSKSLSSYPRGMILQAHLGTIDLKAVQLRLETIADSTSSEVSAEPASVLDKYLTMRAGQQALTGLPSSAEPSGSTMAIGGLRCDGGARVSPLPSRLLTTAIS